MTFSEALKLALFTAMFTFIANFLFSAIKIKFNLFEQKTNCKRDRYYKQLSELYLTIYAIVAQSEYIRYFHNIEGDFEDIPFLEISQRRYTTKINFSKGNTQVEAKEFSVQDAVTEFNKESIANQILENKKYASQKILKLAVAYRYVSRHYTDDTIEPEIKDKFEIEELVTIKRIVQSIVRETNQMLKECDMDYSKEELATGILVNGIVD
jgi:hypothetical protein